MGRWVATLTGEGQRCAHVPGKPVEPVRGPDVREEPDRALGHREQLRNSRKHMRSGREGSQISAESVFLSARTTPGADIHAGGAGRHVTAKNDGGSALWGRTRRALCDDADAAVHGEPRAAAEANAVDDRDDRLAHA